jgi:prophage antirepressor-like protein
MSSDALPAGIRDLNHLFEEKTIRIAGTATSPLFVAADLAAAIKDKNYLRALERYGSRHKRVLELPNRQGELRDFIMLTEVGAYKYLLGSKRPKAEPFQNWVEDQLVTLRREGQVALETQISQAKLTLKIAGDHARFLDNEVRKLRAERRPAPFFKSEETNPGDLLEWCLARYHAENPGEELDRIRRAVWAEIDDEVQRAYSLGYFEQAYGEVSHRLDRAIEGGSESESE